MRNATAEIRDGGIERLIEGLGDGGFIHCSNVRVCRVDNDLYLEFETNAGTFERREFVRVAVSIPLTNEESSSKSELTQQIEVTKDV